MATVGFKGLNWIFFPFPRKSDRRTGRTDDQTDGRGATLNAVPKGGPHYKVADSSSSGAIVYTGRRFHSRNGRSDNDPPAPIASFGLLLAASVRGAVVCS